MSDFDPKAARENAEEQYDFKEDAFEAGEQARRDVIAALDLLDRCEALLRRVDFNRRCVVCGFHSGHQRACGLADLLRDIGGSDGE
jgi:hypothetical protein